MAQLHRYEVQIELKCNAEKLFDVYAHKPYLIPNICPKVSKIELLQGNWGKAGAVHTWYYILHDGAQLASATTSVEVDEENKFVSFIYHDGSAMNYYFKSLKAKIQLIPKNEGCIAKWTFEYEKKNENALESNMFFNQTMNLAIDIAKDIDSHLCDA